MDSGMVGWRRHESSFVLVGVIVFVLAVAWFYRVFWYGFAGLLLDESFGYLGVSLVTVLVLLYLSLRQSGFVYGFSPVRFVVSVFFVVLSLLFYFLGFVYNIFIVQLQGLSLVLLFLAMFIVVFSPVYARDVFPLLGLFLLVPLPPRFFDWLTPWLSRVVGRIVASLTGSVFVSGPGYSMLKVASPEGVVSFEVARACTGIVTMSSVMAVVPIILYLLAYSPRPLGSRLVAAVASAAMGFAAGFAGNVVRVLLVVLGTKYWGPSTGLNLFHYSPSIIYASLAVFASFWVAEKYGGLDISLPRLRVGRGVSNIRAVLGVLILLLVLSGTFIGVVEVVSARTQSEGGVKGIHVASVEDFTRNPLKYLASSDVVVSSSYRDEWLTSVLNALDVYRITIIYNKSYYHGYVEVVDNPARLHTWQLCLQLQRYTILDSYSVERNGTILNIILMEKSGVKYILVYRLFQVKLLLGSDKSLDLWIRISLLSRYREGVLDHLAVVLENISPGTLQGVPIYVSVIRWLSYISYVLLLAVLILTFNTWYKMKSMGMA